MRYSMLVVIAGGMGVAEKYVTLTDMAEEQTAGSDRNQGRIGRRRRDAVPTFLLLRPGGETLVSAKRRFFAAPVGLCTRASRRYGVMTPAVTLVTKLSRDRARVRRAAPNAIMPWPIHDFEVVELHWWQQPQPVVNPIWNTLGSVAASVNPQAVA